MKNNLNTLPFRPTLRTPFPVRRIQKKNKLIISPSGAVNNAVRKNPLGGYQATINHGDDFNSFTMQDEAFRKLEVNNALNDRGIMYNKPNKILKMEVKLAEKGANHEKKGVLLCGIGKMENNYIREWVEHNKKIGFDNICLIDNNDVDGERFEDVIGDYIDSGYVILENARGKFQYQIQSYNVYYEKYKDKYEWIAFFDIDEFLWINEKKYKNVNEFVNDKIFSRFNMIRVCWENYSDSGLIKVEDNNYSVSRFTEKFDDLQSKAIVRTVFGKLNNISPHILSRKTVFTACNTIGVRCGMGVSIGRASTLLNAKLKHYRFKTIEEFVLNKMVRLWPTNYKNGGKGYLNLDFFFRFNKKTDEKIEYANKLLKERKGMDKKKDDFNTPQASAATAVTKDVYVNAWVHGSNDKISHFNWGDDINFFFIPKIMNIKPKIYNKKAKPSERNYQFIGSIIGNAFTNKETIIWGSGIANEQKLNVKPKRVLAVRGPLTRNCLIKSGVDCPEVYGDPALLIPFYYNPKIEKKYKIGIIPHWSNVDNTLLNKYKACDDVKIIRLKGYTKWTDVLDDILSCEYIVSESLHGLILAEAYGIPNLWINIADNAKKNPTFFKYHDFFLSLGKDREKPFKIQFTTTKQNLLDELEKYERVNNLDLQKLIEAAPFQIQIKKE